MKRDMRGRKSGSTEWHRKQAEAARERVAKMYALYKEKGSVIKVAMAYGITTGRVRTLFRAHGYEV